MSCSPELHHELHELEEHIEHDLYRVLMWVATRIEQLEENLMSTMAELVQADADLKDEVGRFIALNDERKVKIAELEALLASATIPDPAEQAELDAVVADLRALDAQLEAALPPMPVVAPVEASPVTDGDTGTTMEGM